MRLPAGRLTPAPPGAQPAEPPADDDELAIRPERTGADGTNRGDPTRMGPGRPLGFFV